MRFKKRLILSLFLLVIFSGLNLFGQNTFSSEDDLKKKSAKLFEDEQYAEAYPLYSQLLSIYPKDPNYNYRFGVCMLYASENKEKALPFLESAAKSPKVDNEVFFFLGKAYHINYRFDDAIKQYNQFKKNASSKLIQRFKVDKQIEMCNNGKSLLRVLKDLVVMDKKEVSIADFFRSYDLSDIGGKLLVKPDEFKTQLDIDKNERSLIYLAPQADKIYYSSYGADGKTGRDIYVATRQPDGEWGKPQNAGTTINTEFDEDYPFLHPNGKTLYFCSKGHNSMGGYDIFKSSFDPNTGSWSKPENLDFPVNTPDDEIMYVTDKEEKVSYFSSARNSPGGSIAVYKTKVDRKPIDAIVVNGKFTKSISQSKPTVKIVVKNLDNNEVEGTYYSNATTGDYVLELPNGGKFLFTVESESMNTQSEPIELAHQTVFAPVKQFMSYDDAGKLKITNTVVDASSDTSYLAAMSFIKDKAKLDVNYNEQTDNTPSTGPQVTEVVTATKDTANKEQPSNGQLSNDAIVKIAYDDAKEAADDAKDLQTQSNNAFALANEKNTLAQTKRKEADDALVAANQISDPAQKQTAIDNANSLKTDADRLERETVSAFNLAKRIELSAKSKQEEADLSQSYAKELETVAKSKSDKGAMDRLEAVKEKLDKISAQTAANQDAVKSLKLDADRKQAEVETAEKRSEQIRSDIAGSEKEIAKMKVDADNAKDADLKAGLLQQVKEIEEDIPVLQKQLADNEVKVQKLKSEASVMQSDVQMVSQFIGQVKTGNTSNEQVATVDKQKLEQNVQNYETTIASQPPLEKPVTAGQVTTTASTTNPEQTKPLVSVASTQSTTDAINEKFTNELAQAEKITAEPEKEKAKSDIYKRWTDELSTEVASQKQALATITDETEKQRLQASISQAEQTVSDKKKLADESSVKATQLNQTPVVTAPANNYENSATTAKYNSLLADADKQPNEVDKENVKAAAYKQWSADLVAEADDRRSKLASITDEKQKENEIIKIRELQQAAKEKQEKQLASENKVKELGGVVTTPPVVAATTPAGNDTAQKQVAQQTMLVKDEVKQPVEPVVNTSQTTIATPNVPVVPDNVTYEQQIAKSQALNKQADSLTSSAGIMRELAQKETDPVSRDAINAKAVELEVMAKQKRNESDQQASIANTIKYKQADAELSQLAASVSGNESDEVTRAGLLKDEATIYIEKAQQDRAEAAKTTDDYTRDEFIQKAKEKEATAAEKQKLAKELYLKYNPTFVYDPNKKASEIKPETVTASSPATPISTKQPDSVINPVSATATPVQTQGNAKLPADKLLNDKRVDLIKDKPAYTTFKTLVQQSNTEAANAEKENVLASELKASADKKQKEVNDAKAQMANTTDELEKSRLKEVISKSESEYITLKLKSDSVKALAKNSEATALSKQTEAELILKNSEPEPNKTPEQLKAEQLAAAAGVSKEAFTAPSNANITFKPNELVFNPARNYSKSNPIPIDPVLPEGLFFKVQVGAFRNPIPADQFKGMSPLMGETTKQGFLRYSAGLFTALDKANIARDKIRGFGYKDAFVIAFYNGKRISMAEALAMNSGVAGTTPATETTQSSGNTTSQVPVNSSTQTSQNTQQGQSTPVVSTPTPAVVDTKSTEPVKSTDIAKVEGALYTVQIGVYSKPVSASRLYNLSPIFNETMTNGNIRYTTGIYSSFAKADNAKNTIVNLGVKDAFVISFRNGKKIDVEEAKTLESQGPSVMLPAEKETGMPVVEAISNTTNTPGNTNVTKPTIIFKVQLGAFKEQVPVEIANTFLKVAGRGVENYVNENGITVYTAGNFDQYEAALALKKEIAQTVKDAFVIAFNNGKKISLDEAKRLLNQ